MTYAAKIDPAERRLDPRRPAEELERTRARPPPAHRGLPRARRGRAARRGARGADAGAAPAPGELAADSEGLVLGCDPGALRLLAVRPPGKREMAAADYLRGHPSPRLAAPA